MGVKLLKSEKFLSHWKDSFKKYLEITDNEKKDPDNRYYLKTDITAFYDSIPHYALENKLKKN